MAHITESELDAFYRDFSISERFCRNVADAGRGRMSFGSGVRLADDPVLGRGDTIESQGYAFEVERVEQQNDGVVAYDIVLAGEQSD